MSSIHWSDGSLLPPSPLVPNPRSTTLAWGVLAALLCTRRMSPCGPAAVGLKVTLTATVLPGASVAGSAGAPMAKGPPPTSVMLVITRLLVPVLLIVTLRASLAPLLITSLKINRPTLNARFGPAARATGTAILPSVASASNTTTTSSRRMFCSRIINTPPRNVSNVCRSTRCAGAMLFAAYAAQIAKW